MQESWKDSHSVTCAHCGAEVDERETIRLEDLGCSQLEEVTGDDYGGAAEFHKQCFEKLTKGLTIEGKLLIQEVDNGLTPADIMPLQDEWSN